jgi:demethylmenaquinone methyltransferase/2-methoxy-6-polyprenyl-1,4-benzoquinol methylase
MPTAVSLQEYYRQRAQDYEAVYAKPERQCDLARLRTWLAEEVRGRTLLEVACGTGYWTAVAAASAVSIVATDVNADPLQLARSKALGAHVVFAQADAYALPHSDVAFDCGMAHFWWSHVARARQREFLSHFASRLGKGARLLMIDNNFVAGSSTPISRADAAGNTYQIRALPTGEACEVLKNFPSTSDIESALGVFCTRLQILRLKYFWAASAMLASTCARPRMC